MGQFSKRWEDLQFSDNFIFCKVMKNKELCIEFLEILLEIKIADITYIESEHPIQDYYDSRGIRMDVYVKDSKRIFNIEMQTSDYTDLLLRARYYQSASDISTTPRRTKFNQLKETFIIFICLEDPFGKGLPKYTEKKIFEETDELLCNDKAKKIFYNASAYDKVQNESVRDVLKFIYKLKAENTFTEKLEKSVLVAKAEPVFKDEYMYFEDILEEEKELAREEGHAEGKAIGIAEGIAEGKSLGIAEGIAEGIEKKANETALNLLKEGISIEIIARCTGLTADQVEILSKK